MKKCSFCAEEIKDEAVKCRYCGEFVAIIKTKTPWYFKTSALVSFFMLVGPFALPLLWGIGHAYTSHLCLNYAPSNAYSSRLLRLYKKKSLSI